MQLSGYGNFVGYSLRNKPTEVERARVVHFCDTRRDFGEPKGPAVLRAHGSGLVFRRDFVVVRDRHTDHHVGRRIICHPLCHGRNQKRPVREPGANVPSNEEDRVVSVDMLQNFVARHERRAHEGYIVAAVLVEHVRNNILWRGPNRGCSTSEQEVCRLVELCLGVHNRCRVLELSGACGAAFG